MFFKRLPHYEAAPNHNLTVPSPVFPAIYGMQHARRPVTTIDHTASHHKDSNGKVVPVLNSGLRHEDVWVSGYRYPRLLDFGTR
jgi:hypothetical protein